MRASHSVLVTVALATAVLVLAPWVPTPAHAQSVGTITVRELEARMDAVNLATLSDGGFVDVPERVVLGESGHSRLLGDTSLPVAIGRSVTCDLSAVCTISEGVGTILVTVGLKWRTVVAQAPGAPPTCIRISTFHYSDPVQDRVVGCGSPAPGTTRYWFLDAPPRLTTYSICFFCPSPDTTCVVPGPTERGWACGTVAGSEEWLPGCVAR